MNKSIRQIGIMLLAVGIMFQPMTGMALADTGDASTGAECQLRGTAGFWGGFLGVGVEQCQTPAENVGENHADAYAQALAAEDTGEFGTTNYQNQLQYSRNNCLCKGQSRRYRRPESREQHLNGESERERDNRRALQRCAEQRYRAARQSGDGPVLLC